MFKFKYFFIALSMLMVLATCKSGPVPIRVGKDACHFCQMSITDTRYAIEGMNSNGKLFIFDDVHCLQKFMAENKDKIDQQKIWVANYNESQNWIPFQDAILMHSEAFRSPMGGNYAAFPNMESANKMQHTVPDSVTIISGKSLLQIK